MECKKAQHEEAVAQIFLRSLNEQRSAEWVLTRAEDKFPEVANEIRWEFVAECSDSPDNWTAVEVKCLVISEGERQNNDWRGLVDAVDQRLRGNPPGKYWLADLPKYTFDQGQKKRLIECLAKIVRETAPSLKDGEQKDIGPTVAAVFDDWPNDIRRQPKGYNLKTFQLLYPPHPLLVFKTSGQGNSLKVGGYPIVGSWEPATTKGLVRCVIAGKQQANAQLGMAKSKGASITVLLLDSHADFDPPAVEELISRLDSSLLAHIDQVYLIGTFGGEHVRKVWPMAG